MPEVFIWILAPLNSLRDLIVRRIYHPTTRLFRRKKIILHALYRFLTCMSQKKFQWRSDFRMTLKWQRANNTETAIWLVYRTDTNARGFWLVKRTLRWKNLIPENYLEINRYFALTSYCNTIGQSINTFSILGFLWRKNEEAMFWSFHPLADKTNNERKLRNYFSWSYENRSEFQAFGYWSAARSKRAGKNKMEPNPPLAFFYSHLFALSPVPISFLKWGILN